jgi:DNA-binding LytR/AlgR family response regulator
MKILLLEDDQGFTDLLLMLLSQIGIDSVFPNTSADEYIDYFSKNSDDIDLCLLDIDLGRKSKNGIQVAQKIRAIDTEIPIIFLTSMYSEQYYAQCKEVNPTAFLSKNIDKIALKQAIELSTIDKKLTTSNYSNSRDTTKNIFVKIGDKYKALALEEITHFSAEKKAVYCYSRGRRYPIRTTLKVIEGKLNSDFLRVHRSYIVNTNMLSTINLAEDTIDVNDMQLPIGAAYKKELLSKSIWLK